MITSGTGTICDECLKVIAEMQWEELLERASDRDNQDPSFPAGRLMKPQIVTRFVNEDVQPAPWRELGVDWICDGCGWRLRLDGNAQPPPDHSHEILMANWLHLGVKEIPPLKFVKMCNARWRRVF
jgi:hypothetical protein